MTLSKPTLGLSTLLFFAITLSVILMLSGNSHHPKASDQTDMDSFMTQISYREYDQKGFIKSILSASQVKHYKNNSEVFIKPLLILYSDDRSIWEVHAQQGTSMNKNQQVYLQGHVTLHHPADKNNPETLITTDQATYFPKTYQIKTSSTITVTRPDAIIQGRGAIADLKNQIVKILSNSRADYVLSQ